MLMTAPHIPEVLRERRRKDSKKWGGFPPHDASQMNQTIRPCSSWTAPGARPALHGSRPSLRNGY
jgi:hypothetical protein